MVPAPTTSALPARISSTPAAPDVADEAAPVRGMVAVTPATATQPAGPIVWPAGQVVDEPMDAEVGEIDAEVGEIDAEVGEIDGGGVVEGVVGGASVVTVTGTPHGSRPPFQAEISMLNCPFRMP